MDFSEVRKQIEKAQHIARSDAKGACAEICRAFEELLKQLEEAQGKCQTNKL